MVSVGSLTKVEVQPGNEAAIVRTLQEAYALVQQEPTTTTRVVFRQGSSTFSVFDTFPAEADNQAHFSIEQQKIRLGGVSGLLAHPLTTNMFQVLAAKLPAQGADTKVTLGFLSRFEAKPGKEAQVEQALNGTMLAVQQLPKTITWFGFRLGPSTFGTLDLFLDEEGRETHYQARWPQLLARAAQMFVEGSLVIEKVDILLAKLPDDKKEKQS